MSDKVKGFTLIETLVAMIIMSTLVLLSFQLWTTVFRPFGKNMQVKFSYIEKAEFEHLIKSKLLKTKTVSFTKVYELNKVQFYDSQGNIILSLNESKSEQKNSLGIRNIEIVKSEANLFLRVSFFDDKVDEFRIDQDVQIVKNINQVN